MTEPNISSTALENNVRNTNSNQLDTINETELEEENSTSSMIEYASGITISRELQLNEINSRVITELNTENLNNPSANILHNISSILSETTAIRLLNGIRRRSFTNILTQESSTITNVSWLSLNNNGNTCRICRHKRSDTELIECPCKCSGTMGHIHKKCLQRWIRFRNNDFCEICKENFNFVLENKNYTRLFKSFFQIQYFGTCLINIMNLVTVTPLVYFTMNQLIIAMEKLNEKNVIRVAILAPVMLLTSSIYFFFYFEWALFSIFRIKNILVHWWNFGDQDDEDYTVPPDNSDEGFFET